MKWFVVLSLFSVFLISCVSPSGTNKVAKKGERDLASELSRQVLECSEHFESKSINYGGGLAVSTHSEYASSILEAIHKSLYEMMPSRRYGLKKEAASLLVPSSLSQVGLTFEGSEKFDKQQKKIFSQKKISEQCHKDLTNLLIERIRTHFQLKLENFKNIHQTRVKELELLKGEIDEKLESADFKSLVDGLKKYSKKNAMEAYVLVAEEMKNPINKKLASRILSFDSRLEDHALFLEHDLKAGHGKNRDYVREYYLNSYYYSLVKYGLAKKKLRLHAWMPKRGYPYDIYLLSETCSKNTQTNYRRDNESSEDNDLKKIADCGILLTDIIDDKKIKFLADSLFFGLEPEVKLGVEKFETMLGEFSQIKSRLDKLRKELPKLTRNQRTILENRSIDELLGDLRFGNSSKGTGRGSGSRSVGGAQLLKFDNGSVKMLYKGEVVDASLLMNGVYFTHISEENKFLVIEKKNLKGMVFPEKVLAGAYFKEIEYQDLFAKRHRFKNLKSFGTHAYHVVGFFGAGLFSSIWEGLQRGYWKLNYSDEKVEEILKKREKQGHKFKDGFWQYSKNLVEQYPLAIDITKANRNIKYLGQQVVNRSIYYQLKSQIERDILLQLLGTSELKRVIHDEYTKKEGESKSLFREKMRDLNKWADDLNLYGSIDSTF